MGLFADVHAVFVSAHSVRQALWAEQVHAALSDAADGAADAAADVGCGAAHRRQGLCADGTVPAGAEPVAHGFEPLGAGGEYAAARGAAGGGAAADRHAQAMGALSVDGRLWPRAVCLRPCGGFRALHPAAHGHFPDGAQKGEAAGFGGVRRHFRGGFRAVLCDHGDQRLRAGNDDAWQDDHAAL